MGLKTKKRCEWAEGDPLMEKYHDTEWGFPAKDDNELFERLTLQIFQAGLSWKTILYRREFTDVFDMPYAIPEAVLADSGLKYYHNEKTGLPCASIMELRQPFEEHIWKNLWTNNLRNKINKAVRRGVTVIEDKELKYRDVIFKMLIANYRRYGTKRDI